MRLAILLLFLTAATLTVAPSAADAKKNAKASYFRSVEVRRSNFKLFTKWTGMLERYEEEKVIVRNCKPAGGIPCTYDNWDTMLEKLQGKDRMTQIDTINRYMNQSRYIIDPVNWGVPDYWETPGQFFIREGDCEDYAITKYMSLKRLGLDPKKMRIVVLQDLNLNIAHAVLIIQINGKNLVLDNQIEKVVEAKTIRHYKPFYSINEEAWWLHRT